MWSKFKWQNEDHGYRKALKIIWLQLLFRRSLTFLFSFTLKSINLYKSFIVPSTFGDGDVFHSWEIVITCTNLSSQVISIVF